eukprot:6189955-Pleurochrysis_carterae.AAC.13
MRSFNMSNRLCLRMWYEADQPKRWPSRSTAVRPAANMTERLGTDRYKDRALVLGPRFVSGREERILWGHVLSSGQHADLFALGFWHVRRPLMSVVVDGVPCTAQRSLHSSCPRFALEPAVPRSV